jgi:hypothetical protein
MMTTMPGVDAYEVGEQVGLTARFGSEADPFEPERVLVRVRDPQGRMAELRYGTDAAVVRTGPGSYQVIVTATIPGRWRYRFVGMGGRTRAEHDGFFDVFDVTSD